MTVPAVDLQLAQLLTQAATVATSAAGVLPVRVPGAMLPAPAAGMVSAALEQARAAHDLVQQGIALVGASSGPVSLAKAGLQQLDHGVDLLTQFPTDGPMVADAGEQLWNASRTFTMAADRATNPPPPLFAIAR